MVGRPAGRFQRARGSKVDSQVLSRLDPRSRPKRAARTPRPVATGAVFRPTLVQVPPVLESRPTATPGPSSCYPPDYPGAICGAHGNQDSDHNRLILLGYSVSDRTCTQRNVSGRRGYDRGATTRQDDKAASRLAPKGEDGRFNLYVAMNGRNDWLDLE